MRIIDDANEKEMKEFVIRFKILRGLPLDKEEIELLNRPSFLQRIRNFIKYWK